MKKGNLLSGFAGIAIGLVIGFFAANALNQDSVLKTQSAVPVEEPFAGQEIQNMVVRDQPTSSGAMPHIAEALEKAKTEPANFDAQIAAGDLYLKIQNFPKAIEHFESANKVKPTDYDAIVKIGNTYFDSKQFEKAEVWYLKALDKRPDDFAVRTDLGVTFVERSNPDLHRAIKEFELALESNSKHEATLYNLAVSYYKSGNLQKAKTMSGQLESINSKGELSSRLRNLFN